MSDTSTQKPLRIGILGAGISGLSAAYFLQSHADKPNLEIEVFEASKRAGGMARSFNWHGVWCDIAPHRLYTQDKQLLEELMQLVPMHMELRKSKIFIQGKWITDPVNPFEILRKFFPGKSLSILLSYLKAKLLRTGDGKSFEGLVLNKFGTGLNEFFFKPYSEKLFGIPSSQISAEWGKRKIRVSGFRDMLKKDTKLYFDSFYYPNCGGYGAISETLYHRVSDKVQLETAVTGVSLNRDAGNDGRNYSCTFEASDGKQFTRDYDVLISTLPITTFAQFFGQQLDLSFRPARLLYLNVNRADLTGMHWFYIADAAYRVNRVAEFKNFSRDHDAADNTVICVEVTDQENFSIDNIIGELERAGVLSADDVTNSMMIDIANAYPVYDLNYADERSRAQELFSQYPGIYLLGRNAQFSHVDVDEIFSAAKKLSNELVASLI